MRRALVGKKLLIAQAEGGFTLVELMVAMTLASFLSLALFQTLLQSQHMADFMSSGVTMNQEARENFEMLADGGVNGVTSVPGFHAYLAANQWSHDANRQLSMTGGSVALVSRAVTNFSVTCAAAGDPLPYCAGTETINNIAGFVGAVTLIGSNGIRTPLSTTPTTLPIAGNETTDVELLIVDVNQVPRGSNPRRFTVEETRETYWTAFTRMID